MGISTYTTRSHLIVAAYTAIMVTLLYTLALRVFEDKPEGSARSRLVALSVDEELAKLEAPTKGVELISRKAMDVRDAIKQKDYAAADKITAAVLAKSRLQGWNFHPFSAFIAGIPDVEDPAFEARLTGWVDQNRDDALPVLVRAKYYYDVGWFKRGRNFAADIQRDNMKAFTIHMALALADVELALRLNPANPYAYQLRLSILRGSGKSDRMETAFNAAIAKYPGYYPLYDIFLTVLEPRWGGTIDEMYGFVERYAAHAPERSPLKLLYLGLYRSLIQSAAVYCRGYELKGDGFQQCVAAVMKELTRPALNQGVVEAFKLYDHVDKYRYSLALEPLLFDILRADNGGALSGALLQLAADNMHSDTQLKQDVPGGNNYIIDKALAEAWRQKGHHENAINKGMDALADVKAMAFPGPEEKDLAVAGIYGDISRNQERISQYIETIAYMKAAIALGLRTDEEHYICYSYFMMKAYEAAVDACTDTMSGDPENLKARYWRANTYQELGLKDEALADFKVIADSEDSFRPNAAISMSMIHFDRKDNRGALAVLNKYAYLYDPDTTQDSSIAIAYNNRCYAYKELGELAKALDDCNASLKYGNIPDAYRKQQELIKLLEPKA